MAWRYIMKTCKLYLPVVRTLEITKIIDFNQADYTWYCVCCYFSEVNFDWSIILIWKSFGAFRHISGKLGVKWAIDKKILIEGTFRVMRTLSKMKRTLFTIDMAEAIHQ